MDAATETPPLAKVGGEPYTQLPRDLYIPPDALEVFLETFEGPLDLLLYLIRRQSLNILDIPVAEITRQYMEYLALMREMRLELAAEYLVMAAWLAEIKSRLLLPRPAAIEAEEEDPRAELVRRLQEYERFQQAARALDALPRLERDCFPASAEPAQRETRRAPPPVNLAELLAALREVLARAELFGRHHIRRETLSVRERMSQVLERLDALRFTPFSALFRPEEGRMGVVVTLLAVLELLREALLELVQAEPFAPIHVRRRG
ncbi:MAG: segregation/condensation protein A [Candidatus Contendobacter sp.]|nr:segregation/condensation protein A [Candidatus Contendobacter sp.]MDG4558830.1 segregation/condensation protein A [Candidatus Contendobacter sp.]